VPFTSESKEAIADYDEIRKEIRLAMMDCGRKLQGYLNRRKRQRYEGQRRNIFERYIGEVVRACGFIKKINEDQFYKDLSAIAKTVTARADEKLDEHGKVMKDEDDGEFGANTIVVDREAPAAAPQTLFADDAARPGPAKRRKR